MKFNFILKVKDCDKDFGGLGPGILVIQEVSFNVKREQLDEPMFHKALFDTAQEFVEKYIEVQIEEKEDEIQTSG